MSTIDLVETLESTGESLKVEFTQSRLPGEIINNSDSFTFNLSVPGGQPFKIDGRETDKATLTIYGNWELRQFLDAMVSLHGRLYK